MTKFVFRDCVQPRERSVSHRNPRINHVVNSCFKLVKFFSAFFILQIIANFILRYVALHSLNEFKCEIK